MSTFAKEPILLEFSRKFLPGKVLESPQILLGGALHQNWKVVTAQGSYVVKEINPTIAIKPDVIKNYEASEIIAHQFAAIGLPAIAAIKISSSFIHSFEKSFYIIYPFAKGHVLPAEKIEKSHAKIVGSIFKTMHISKLNTYQTLPHYDLFSNAHWTTIIQNSNEPNLIKLLPTILTWNDLYHSAIPKLNETIVISHRDLHYSNILWDDLTPSIIDWESAGSTNPLQEVLGFALEWSGIIACQFNKEIAKLLEISAPKVSSLMSGKINDFSNDTLMNYLTLLGCNIEIRVVPKNLVSKSVKRGKMKVKRPAARRRKSTPSPKTTKK